MARLTMARLNDIEALVRQGIKPAEFKTADESAHPAHGSADRAVAGPRPGRFRREVGAGSESLSEATTIAEEC